MAIPSHEEVLNHFKRNLRFDVQGRVDEAFKNYWKSPCPVKEPIDFKLVVKFDWELQEEQIQQAESVLAEGKWENFVWCTDVETGCSTLVVKLDHQDALKYSRIPGDIDLSGGEQGE